MTAVTARRLTKWFETTCAVDGVDLDVGDGEVTGLLGPNGAGKTTLLRMLLGLVRPDEGTIELLGRPLRSSGAPVLEGVSGFVEEPSFYPYLSGRANLEVLAELDDGASRRRIDDALEQVDLAPRADDRVGGYSSGMRQRLGLAAALIRRPRLLVLDEPTAGLDPAGIRFVGELIRSLSDEGVAVLLSSHQIGEVEVVCDAFTVLNEGRVAWAGTAEQMRAQAPPGSYLLMTSDDTRSRSIADGRAGVLIESSPGGGLTVMADGPSLDDFVLALGQADVAVRRLELTMSPAESMFFALTDGSPAAPPQVREDARPMSRQP